RTVDLEIETAALHIQEHGFALIPAVFSPDEADAVTSALSGNSVRRSRAGARHILSDPTVTALAKDTRLMNLARQVLGQQARPYRATLFEKSPSSNWLVVWHQDTALPLRQQRDLAGWGPWSVKDGIPYAHAPAAALEEILALQVHLDDSTDGNGPLR